MYTPCLTPKPRLVHIKTLIKYRSNFEEISPKKLMKQILKCIILKAGKCNMAY